MFDESTPISEMLKELSSLMTYHFGKDYTIAWYEGFIIGLANNNNHARNSIRSKINQLKGDI